jgi:PDZ domain-containing protein
VKRLLTPLRLAVAGVVLLAVTFVLLLTTTSNSFLLVPDRAHPLAALVEVPGGHDQADGGAIYYVDVLERKASLLERIFPGLREGSTLVKHTDIVPPGITDKERIEADRRAMELSQQIASAVALRELGYKVKILLDGVRVARVSGNSSAIGKLESGDVILAVDGKRVYTTTQLRDAVGSHAVGDVLHVSVRRNGSRREFDIRSAKDQETGRPILGILAETSPALAIRLPLKIKFNLRNVGGPSAGLAFALQILEESGRNVDHGYRVAATGVIEPDGSVGEIGGVKQKTIGARRAHVDVFLVPAGDNYRDARKYAHGLRLIPVKTFQQALHALATLPPKRHENADFGTSESAGKCTVFSAGNPCRRKGGS